MIRKLQDGIEAFLTGGDTGQPRERLNRERRRTPVVGRPPDGNAALMPACARLRYAAGTQWGNKKCMEMKYSGC